MHGTLERIQAEFLEMPGLRLTVHQVRRLCGVDDLVCKAVLDALVEAKFLCVKSDGSYARQADGPDRRRPAKAEHRASTPIKVAS